MPKSKVFKQRNIELETELELWRQRHEEKIAEFKAENDSLVIENLILKTRLLCLSRNTSLVSRNKSEKIQNLRTDS